MSTTRTPRLTARTFLVHGLLAGLLGGVLAFAAASVVGEPPIDRAIALEESGGAAADTGHSHEEGAHSHEESGGHSHGDDDAAISRGEQAGPGRATATIIVGLVAGGVVGIASAFAVGRLGGLGPVASTAVVVLLAYLAYTVVPWLKYPPNPPAVGSADTIGERTALYFSFVAVSLLAVVAAVLLARALLARGPWVAVVAGAALYLVVVGVAGLVLAPIDEVPDSFPATTLYTFRIGSLATSTALWAGVALALTGLTARTWRAHQADVERRAAAAAL
ncbi:CbtA family protein [Aeromicrobium sp.]|uniref:CbtA family protein n=1 Tax=Aeromicrobium sp. TaxID=1871063 RepID=UPI0035143E15